MACSWLVDTLPENYQVSWLFLVSWSDGLKLAALHFYLGIIRYVDGLWCLEVIFWSWLVGTLPEYSPVSWCLWCIEVMAWTCLIGALPENPPVSWFVMACSCLLGTLSDNYQVSWWFAISWSDGLKLAGWQFTWEFSSKLMVYDVLKRWLSVGWLTLYLRILG